MNKGMISRGLELIGLILASSAVASAGTITDSFEGSSISSFWTTAAPLGFGAPITGAGPGTETLTSEFAHTGSQSVRLQASTTFPGFASLTHNFGIGETGTISVFMKGGVQSSAQMAFELDDFGVHLAALEEYQDSYLVRIYPADPGVAERDVRFSSSGPNDWHQLQFQVDSSGLTASIDGGVVAFESSIKSFSVASLEVWAGNVPTTGSAYFDDFSFTSANFEAAPEPSSGPLAMAGMMALISALRWSGAGRTGRP